MAKFYFAPTTQHYLGYVISREGVATDPTKVKAVQYWPTPTLVKDIHSFLGLAGYYRKFVDDFSILNRQLFSFLKRDRSLFGKMNKKACQELKKALVTAQCWFF